MNRRDFLKNLGLGVAGLPFAKHINPTVTAVLIVILVILTLLLWALGIVAILEYRKGGRK